MRIPRWEKYHGIAGARVWVKLESYNPSGSAKDRTAASMVAKAQRAGVLQPGTMVVESSSGNLGIALSRQAILHHFDFHCVVDPRTNASTLALMEAFGATIHKVSAPDPETGDWLAARRSLVRRLLENNPGAITFDQYSNEAAFDAHAAGTMTEILDALDRPPARVYVAVSTTGTFGGCVKKVADAGVNTLVIPVDSTGSVLFGGRRACRALPGYGAGVVPELSRSLDGSEIRRVTPLDAVAHARILAETEAILPGASGGAVLAAAANDLSEFLPGDDVVLIVHDDGVGYLNTVYNDDWVSRTLGADKEKA